MIIQWKKLFIRLCYYILEYRRRKSGREGNASKTGKTVERKESNDGGVIQFSNMIIGRSIFQGNPTHSQGKKRAGRKEGKGVFKINCVEIINVI